MSVDGPLGFPRWVNVLGVYGLFGATYIYMTWKTRKAFRGDSGKETRVFEMMMDEEKIFIREGAVEITISLEEITEVGEHKGYVMVRRGEREGRLTALPKEQLLDDELKLLEGVKSRLSA